MPSGGDDQSQGNAPGNSGGGGGRGSSSSSSGGGGGGYAGDGGGYGSSATGGGGSPGGSGGGGSFGDGGTAAPAGGRGTPAPSTGGYTPSAVAGLTGYVGANDTGYFSGTSGSAGNTVGGLASAYGDMGRSMASVGIGGLGGRSSVASSYSAPSQYSGLAAAYSSMRGEDYTSPAVSTMPSFESLTRSMNAPALGMQATPAPSYATGTMAYDMVAPTDMRSSVGSRSVSSKAVDGRGVAPMGQEVSSLSSAKEALFSMLAPVEGGRHGANSVNYASPMGVRSMDVVGTTVGDMISKMAKADGVKSLTHVGTYQLGRPALAAAVKAGVVSTNQNLDEKAQKAVASFLTDRRAKQATVNGVVDESRLAKALAQEWAALPTEDEKSYYAGRSGNKSAESLSYADVKGMASALAAAYNGEASKATGRSANASFAQSYLGVTPTISKSMPGIGPVANESRNMGVVADRMATEKADKVAASQEFASRYLGEMYGDRTKGNAGVDASKAAPASTLSSVAKSLSITPETPRAEITKAGSHVNLSKVDPKALDFVAALAGVAGVKSVTINSGHRSKEYNDKVGGASKSKHVTGTAVDVSRANMSKEQQVAFVAAANANKAAAVISYSKYNHFHVEPPGNRGVGRETVNMFNSSSKNFTERASNSSQAETHLAGIAAAKSGAGVSVAAPSSVAAPVSSYAPQPSITGPGNASPSSVGLSVADTRSSTTSAPAPSETLAAQVSQEAATTTPETAPSEAKGLGVAGRWGARAIDIGTAAIPGVGTVVGVVNGVLSLTGNKSVGTMVMEGFVNGERGEYTGTSGLEGDPYMPEPVETQETNIDATPAQAVASFTDKYIYPEKKYPTPEEKWGRSSIG